MTPRAQHWTALLILGLATASASASFVLFKASALAHAPFAVGESSWFLTAHDLVPRFALGVLALLALYGASVLKLTRTEWTQAAFMATTSFAGCMFQLDGLQRTSAGTTAFLTQFYVILIPLWWALLIRRRPAFAKAAAGKPGWAIAVACGLVLIGVAVLARVDWATFRIGRGEAEVLIGAVFFSLLLSALSWPAFAGNRAERTSAGMFLIEAGLFAVVSVLTCREPANLVAAYTSPGWLGIMIAATIFGTIGPFVVMNHWQRFVTATEAGMLYCLGSVFATLAEIALPGVLSRWVGIDYANQPVTFTLAIGGGFILGANVLLQLMPVRKTTELK